MLVYRVEDSEGLGMYSSDVLPWYPPEGMKDRHPSASNDSLLWGAYVEETGSYKLLREWHFGFSSVEQLNNWLYNDEWKRELMVSGFFVSVYECERAIAGYTQAMFDKTKSVELVNTMELCDER